MARKNAEQCEDMGVASVDVYTATRSKSASGTWYGEQLDAGRARHAV